MVAAFDTLQASRRLKAAGFDEAQADTLVAIFAEDVGASLATKNDLAALQTDLRHEITTQRSEVTHEFAAVRSEVAHESAAVRAEMKDLERRLTIRMGAMFAAALTILLAALGLVTSIILTA